MNNTSYQDFFDALGERESSGTYNSENQFGFIGKYQFGEAALFDLGYYGKDRSDSNLSKNDWIGNWSGKNGLNSKQDYLVDKKLVQEIIVQDWMGVLWNRINLFELGKYEGQILNGNKITISGMLAASHLLGVGGLRDYLLTGAVTGPQDGNGVTAKTYMNLFEGYQTPFQVDHSIDESIKGGNGEDVLTGARGNDTLIGGSGFDTYIITQSGDGLDTIFDSDGQGKIVITSLTNQSLFEITGNATPISGGTNGNQLYSIANNNIKLEYNLTTKVLNIVDWVGKGSNDKIIINDFDSGELGITLSQPQSINLISGLGGPAGFGAGFGEQSLTRNDDGSTGRIDITSIFEDNINFFGREFSSLWINNNGSVTFNGARGTYTPNVITGISNNPEITPFFADVDTRGGQVSPTPGGNSTGSNLVYYDFDTVNDRFIVTWDDVGYYSSQTDKLNAFQLILTDRGSGDFDIEFRYEDVNWTTGSASGGSGGLGGTVARAGYTAGTGDPAAFFELPASGNQDAMLALDETVGNAGDVGRWEFKVRSGDVVTSNIPPLPPIGVNGWTVGDPHISTLDGVGYDFQAAGEFVMLRGVSNPSFEIQARMVPIGNNVSVNSAIATNLGGVAVMVDAQDVVPLQIGGVATTINNFSSINVGNDRIFREDNTYTIVYAGNDGVVNAGDSRLIVDVFSNRVDIDVRLNTEMAGDLEGLFGNGDGNPDNDIALADGTVLDRPLAFEVLYGQYRDDWRVSSLADSLFTYDNGESLDGFYLPAYPRGLARLEDLDPAVRAAAEQAVLDAGLTPGTANFNNAVLDFALTGDSSYIASSLGVPRISEGSHVSVIPPVEIPVEIISIGDAPLRVSRSDPDAWKNAWTDTKIDISHKANHLDAGENWSSAALNGNNSNVLSGGDIFGGDLGVSGQSLVSSTIRQEIDGTEALRFDLDQAATKVTLDLSRLDGNSATGHFDAGRLQLLDDGGTVVDELIFSADAVSHEKQITLEHSTGFSSVVLTTGIYHGDAFIYGGLSDANGQYLSDPQDVGNGTWNASDYLVDAAEFEFGNITLVGIAA